MNEETTTFVGLSIFLLTVFVISLVLNMSERNDMIIYCTESEYIFQQYEEVRECRMLKCLYIHVMNEEEKLMHEDKMEECYSWKSY